MNFLEKKTSNFLVLRPTFLAYTLFTDWIYTTLMLVLYQVNKVSGRTVLSLFSPKKYIYIFVSILISFPCLLSATHNTYYQEIVNIFLRGFSDIVPEPLEEEEGGRKRYGAKLRCGSDRETMKTVMVDIYGENTLVKKMLQQNEHIVNAKALEEMCVLIGPEGSSHNMINSLDTKGMSHTAGMGFLAKGVLAVKLSMPTTKRKDIERLQQIIRILEEDPALRHALLDIFSRFRVHEKDFIDLYNERHAVRTSQQKKYLSHAYASGNKLGETYLWRLELNKRWGLDFCLLYLSFFSIPMFFAHIYYQLSSWMGFYLMGYLLGKGKIPVAPRTTLSRSNNGLERFSTKYDLVSSIMSIFSLPHLVRRFYYIHKDNLTLLAKVFYHQQKWLETAKEVYETIHENTKLAHLCQELLTFTSTIIEGKHRDQNLAQLLELLSTQKLNKFSLFFSSAGKLLKTVGLYEDHHHKLHPMIYEIAFIEVLANLAHYKANARKHKNGLCYSTFVDTKEMATPFFHFKGLWNSGINHEKAVPNDVLMDGKEYNCALIFGPNAGGKTSFMTAIRSILLSQTVGLDFAEEATHSIVHAFLTYLHIKGSVVKGLSQYTAEITRIEEIMDALDRLGRDKVAICLHDEPITGTNHLEAAYISFEIIDFMSRNYPNAALFFVSHYPLLKTLADENEKVRNFRVVISFDKEGNFSYTYKIKPGTSSSDDRIALCILERWPRFAKIAKKARNRARKN